MKSDQEKLKNVYNQATIRMYYTKHLEVYSTEMFDLRANRIRTCIVAVPIPLSYSSPKEVSHRIYTIVCVGTAMPVHQIQSASMSL